MSAVYDILTILPLSALAVILFGGTVGVPAESIWGYLLCLVMTTGLILLRHMQPKNRIRSIGILAVFLIGLALAAGEENRALFWEEYRWVLWIAGFSAAALVLGILSDLSIWIRRAVTAAPFLCCITGTVLGREISKAVFALSCFLLLVRLAEELQRRWKKSGSPDRKAHITRIAPFFLAVCLTVYLLPAPAEPYNWQFVKDLWNGTALLAERICGSLTHPSEEYANIGFSDAGGFASGLSGNDEEVLLIHTDNPTIRHYKLVGCISGEFTGREWVFPHDGESCTRMLDTVETACAIRKHADSFQSDYLQKVALQYEVRLYNTQYLFAPAKIKVEATKDLTPGLTEQSGSILSKKKLQYKDDYTILCYVLNYGSPQLGALLSDAEPISETEWNKTANAEKVLNKPGCSYADYQAYRREVYETYCRPVTVSEDVSAILDGIERTSENRYEALKQLEACFKEMAYDTNCGGLPDSVTDAGSYLDWFLFTSKKGYCMHYATAFTLMANAMGIPCRYVQGYNAVRGDSGDILVLQSNAHAWPEAYFDNVGWVAFEPTPGYSVQGGWEQTERKPYSFEQYVPVPDEGATEPAVPEEPEVHQPIDPLIFVIPSAAAISFLLLLWCISLSLSRRKYRRMSNAEKFRSLTQQSLRYLGYLGFRMEEGETLAEFRERILQSDQPELHAQLGFLPLYEAVLYADRTLTEEDIRAAEQSRRSLCELVKRSKLRFRLLLLLQRA